MLHPCKRFVRLALSGCVWCSSKWCVLCCLRECLMRLALPCCACSQGPFSAPCLLPYYHSHPQAQRQLRPGTRELPFQGEGPTAGQRHGQCVYRWGSPTQEEPGSSFWWLEHLLAAVGGHWWGLTSEG